MVAEAPLRLDGHIAWDEATHWHFEDGTHRLLAKRQSNGEMLAVVCDHLGTPKEMFDAKGTLVWVADHHVWGAVRAARTFGALAVARTHDREPSELQCRWRFPGQYEDAETGLYYNRHRHYDPLTGQYASPDPIGLAGGDRPQGYVVNPSVVVDPLGLSAWMTATHRDSLSSGKQLYRGDARAPSEIFAEGFKPWGDSKDIIAHAIHAKEPPSYFVSTSSDIAVASKPHFSQGKYVYHIDKRVQGIDVNKYHNLSGKTNFHEAELEIAVPGAVRPSDIIGVQPVLPGNRLGPMVPNPNYVP